MPTLAELDDPKVMAREAKAFAELCAEEEKRRARNMMAVEDGPELSQLPRPIEGGAWEAKMQT